MRRGPKENAQLLAWARVLRADGLTWSAIAKRLGVNPRWFKRRQEALGFPPGPVGRITNPTNMQRVQEMRDKGIRWKLIARELGVDNWHTLARKFYMSRKTHTDLEI